MNNNEFNSRLKVKLRGWGLFGLENKERVFSTYFRKTHCQSSETIYFSIIIEEMFSKG
jgi:hypothetical protein